jgi:2-amino-4-hydroxy-6-hydroxymethyldihydropteridine diphosphokinase
VIAYLSLGSNLASAWGDPAANIQEAVRRLGSLEDLAVDGLSRVFFTEPQDKKDQPWFANQVVRLRLGTGWTPETLLAACQDIENSMGRERMERFGPRIIDIDLLDVGGVRLDASELTLPHPRMAQRAFVLVPLRDLEPEYTLPNGQSLENALGRIAFRVDGERIYHE